ncbi:hypothetical protein [Rhizobium sp. RU36D]|uniref:hypothetical protein n=1 Tax=Rhizobium sp. RU36D TaxID=1907415 RepID=UPI0009D7F9FC|nr:hypothetical protein [Rhizobium sp. RU36D]SMC84582.1 hypothetical protein SAMN05880593_10817 [Rhizobium sp. RU36D]
MLDLYYLAVAALDRNTTPRSRPIDRKAEEAFYESFRESPLQRVKKAVAQFGATWRKVDVLASAQAKPAAKDVCTYGASQSGSQEVAASACRVIAPHTQCGAQALASHQQGQAA